jgi:predicted Holliday junction resolvase-like endonuclease
MYKDKLYKETTPPLKELQNKRKKESREKSVSKSQNVKKCPSSNTDPLLLYLISLL